MQNDERAIKITELRYPVITAEHRHLIDYFDRNPIDLSETGVLDAARQGTGLNDFGADDFRERLRAILDRAHRDPNRTSLGRYQVYSMCVKFASARLRLTELTRCHPEIHDVQIRKPIVIVGPPRSASTYLHNLLAADSRLRSLSPREAFDPAGFEFSPVDELNPELASQIAKVDRATSIRLHGVPPSADANLALEAILLQGLDFAPGLIEGLNVIHYWQDYDHNYDQTPHYQYMETALKALQWQRGPQRWVIKSPHFTEQLRPLLSVFPDAFIVFTHRDPSAIIKSMTKLISVAAQMHLREVDVASIAAYWIDRIDKLLREVVRCRANFLSERSIDVYFDSIMNDSIESVRQIYDAVGMQLNDDQIARMEEFIQGYGARAAGQVSCSFQRDLGLHPDSIDERYGYYYRRFAV